MTISLANNIPASFIESELNNNQIASLSIAQSTPKVNVSIREFFYTEIGDVVKRKLSDEKQPSYMEEYTAPPPGSRVNNQPTQDLSTHHITLPSTGIIPFGSEFFGDGGSDVPFPVNVTIYYRMMAKDTGTSNPIQYRVWTVEDYPDDNGSVYASLHSSDPVNYPLVGSLQDITISSYWEVSK